MSGALNDIRVIDLSTDLSGAWAARLFGDQGADVILAEPPTGHCLLLGGSYCLFRSSPDVVS